MLDPALVSSSLRLIATAQALLQHREQDAWDEDVRAFTVAMLGRSPDPVQIAVRCADKIAKIRAERKAGAK